MKTLLTLHRRVAWLHLLSYLIIVVVEIIVLRNLSGTMEAMVIRYITFFGVVIGTFWWVRQRIIIPIEAMKEASLRIANGDYHKRLPTYASIELNELAQAFNQMVTTIESVEQQRVELIGDVAHELRTPLSNIRITMEGLMDEVLPADPATFSGIQHEVGRLQRLVYQLEALSRAESGQLPLHKQPLSYHHFVAEICSRLQIQFEDKGVDLMVEIPDTLPPVLADPDLMTQVLTNLLGNALQYTPTQGRVTVSAALYNDELVTRIQDTGIGIPAADLPRIFERFYRVDKSRARSSGGNGIGLTIAKHLIYAHNGYIRAESEGANQGTTLVFTLPMP
jgi:signal transduction histidine kinase